MNLARAFARAAASMPSYFPAEAVWPGEAVTDAGGSIVTPAEPVRFDCRVQIDATTDMMRAADGYTDGDVRLLCLSEGLGRALDTAATVTVLSGPHGGDWMLAAVERDPLGVGYVCRGRRA